MSKILRSDYEEVLKRNPNDIRSMIALGCHSFNLGYQLLQQQKRNQALYWFDAAISLDPNMVDSLCGKGNCMINTQGDALQLFDKHQKAIQWYDRALSIAPNHVPSLVGKGTQFFKLIAKALYQLEIDFNKLAKPKLLNKQKTEYSLNERDSLEKQKLEQRFKEKGIKQCILQEDQSKERLEIRLKEKEKLNLNKEQETKLNDKGTHNQYSQAKALHQYKIEALLQGKPKPKHQIELEQEIELELESQKYFDQALSSKPNQIQALTGKGLCINTFYKQLDAENIINKVLSLPSIQGHNDKQSDIYAAKGTILINSR
ncbi:unnamed protein product (macronuclear) [Paramecium tetraurelia]|uniref:Uncharacterized protein n=1 Tax=Paramecium tetraurelia TaxID=5888 RepID=A0D1E7_PARTE|nr:uncharacterized protein GSPATT00012388001 [Paramecium tetraurelia]CAK76864.1 unnamed protein product [Paramecium tetraurelia]|eukprot:XP_001444261.1 hypothetical protein (macronuclear) [Paramecium tetraurelia strain d4-2]